MELHGGASNESIGLVVLMVEKGKGLIVSVGATHRGKAGQWCNSWHSSLKHSRCTPNSEYWEPFQGKITLEND